MSFFLSFLRQNIFTKSSLLCHLTDDSSSHRTTWPVNLDKRLLKQRHYVWLDDGVLLMLMRFVWTTSESTKPSHILQKPARSSAAKLARPELTSQSAVRPKKKKNVSVYRLVDCCISNYKVCKAEASCVVVAFCFCPDLLSGQRYVWHGGATPEPSWSQREREDG